jgi:hypothetical protein
MKAVLPLVLLLAACNQAPRPPAANNSTASEPAPAAPPAQPAAKAFVFDEKTALVEFHYGWSVEAAAVPELVERFRSEMDKQKAELTANAKEDKANRAQDGYPFNPYSSSTEYSTAGQTQRLLSLSVDVSAYTGGAHGNFGSDSLLWDRTAHKEIGVADLFDPPTRFATLVSKPWCDALNAERIKKRQEQPKPGEMFWDCPPLSGLAIVPIDNGKHGKFESIRFSAAPYVAGPYVEGQYDIDLPVTTAMLAAMKPEFRASFEVQPQ